MYKVFSLGDVFSVLSINSDEQANISYRFFLSLYILSSQAPAR